jgi:hypothetical protein
MLEELAAKFEADDNLEGLKNLLGPVGEQSEVEPCMLGWSTA